MDSTAIIPRCINTMMSAVPSMFRQEQCEALKQTLAQVVDRGYFKPAEEDELRAWFACYLTTRSALLEMIDDLRPIAMPGRKQAVNEQQQLYAFVLGYTAACVLVRAGRFFVADLATHKLVQRKLNEAAPTYRIPRKQYTHIYRSLTHPRHAWELYQVMQFARENRAQIDKLADDPRMGPIVHFLDQSESALDMAVQEYVKARLRYRWHSWRRRRASVVQQGLFHLYEVFGRVIADVGNPFHQNRLTPDIHQQVESMLQPGDVLVTRHDQALSNLFLPGYWPHASLYVGPADTRHQLALDLDQERAARWVEPLRVLEAKKDGVKLRPLTETLAVDALALLRPCLSSTEIARALSQALVHEGKLYNFDFDFFTDDRLVCTEVVYRAYEGFAGFDFPLKRHVGILTLTAEDVVRLAVKEKCFESVAVFGTPVLGNQLVTGSSAHQALSECAMHSA